MICLGPRKIQFFILHYFIVIVSFLIMILISSSKHLHLKTAYMKLLSTYFEEYTDAHTQIVRKNIFHIWYFGRLISFNRIFISFPFHLDEGMKIQILAPEEVQFVMIAFAQMHWFNVGVLLPSPKNK